MTVPFVASLALAAALPLSALAETPPSPPGPAPAAHFFVESNPGTFIFFRGFEISVGVRLPGSAHHWRVRALVDHEHIPQLFVDMDRRDTGWHVSDTFAAITGDYFFGSGRGGFHASASLAVGRVHLTAPMSGNSTDLTRLGTRFGAGYQWFPFKTNGFYVDPWLFLLVSPPFGGQNESTIGTETYHQPVVIPAGILQVGYEL